MGKWDRIKFQFQVRKKGVVPLAYLSMDGCDNDSEILCCERERQLLLLSWGWG